MLTGSELLAKVTATVEVGEQAPGTALLNNGNILMGQIHTEKTSIVGLTGIHQLSPCDDDMVLSSQKLGQRVGQSKNEQPALKRRR